MAADTPLPTASPWLVRWARIQGVILILGGAAHTLGVARRFLIVGVPDGHRVAYLAFIAAFQLATGALDLVGASGLARGERSALGALVVAAALITAYGVTVTPLLMAASLPFRVMPVLYPMAHVALAVAAYRGRAR